MAYMRQSGMEDASTLESQRRCRGGLFPSRLFCKKTSRASCRLSTSSFSPVLSPSHYSSFFFFFRVLLVASFSLSCLSLPQCVFPAFYFYFSSHFLSSFIRQLFLYSFFFLLLLLLTVALFPPPFSALASFCHSPRSLFLVSSLHALSPSLPLSSLPHCIPPSLRPSLSFLLYSHSLPRLLFPSPSFPLSLPITPLQAPFPISFFPSSSLSHSLTSLPSFSLTNSLLLPSPLPPLPSRPCLSVPLPRVRVIGTLLSLLTQPLGLTNTDTQATSTCCSV